jgi:hypothetical protein
MDALQQMALVSQYLTGIKKEARDHQHDGDGHHLRTCFRGRLLAAEFIFTP